MIFNSSELTKGGNLSKESKVSNLNCEYNSPYFRTKCAGLSSKAEYPPLTLGNDFCFGSKPFFLTLNFDVSPQSIVHVTFSQNLAVKTNFSGHYKEKFR